MSEMIMNSPAKKEELLLVSIALLKRVTMA